MEDHKKHIDDLFREGLRDYKETPPPGVWTSLEQRLPEPDGRGNRWMWLPLLLLLLGTAAYFVYHSSKENTTDSQNLSQENLTSTRPDGTFGIDHPGSTGGDNQPLERKELNATDFNNPKITDGSTNRFNNIHEPASKNDDVVKNGKTSKSNDQVANTNQTSNVNTTQPNPTAQERKRRNSSGNDAVQNQTEKPTVALQNKENKAVGLLKNKNDNAQSPDGKRETGKSEGDFGEKTIAAKSPQKKTGNSEKQGQKATDRKLASNTPDNSYLLQPTPEDLDSDSEQNEDGDDLLTASARKSKNKEEDEVKKGLLYIPQEAFPKTADVPANETKNTERNKENAKPEPVTTKKKSAAEDPAKNSGKPINVTSATGTGEGIDVKPATFKKNAATGISPTETNNAENKVTSISPEKKKTDADQTVNEKITTKNEMPAGTFPASASGASVTEEKIEMNPSLSGGGGEGGGGAVPGQRGGKFRFDLGLKAGYERGFADFTTNTFIISPYLQWNISTGFAFVFQPGFRFNQLNRNDISNAQKSYHNITNAKVSENHIYTTDSNGQQSTVQRNYLYTNIYDSVVVGSTLKSKNFWEIEIPILLRYKIASNLAIFGGISMMFGNMIQMEEQQQTFSGQQRSSQLSFGAVNTALPPPNVPPADMFFNYSTPPLSTKASEDPNPATNPVRLGLMIGLSYELQKRFTVDIMYKQTISDMKYVPNESIRKIYTQPYLRVMVGYKLFEGGKQEPTIKNPADL